MTTQSNEMYMKNTEKSFNRGFSVFFINKKVGPYLLYLLFICDKMYLLNCCVNVVKEWTKTVNCNDIAYSWEGYNKKSQKLPIFCQRAQNI